MRAVRRPPAISASVLVCWAACGMAEKRLPASAIHVWCHAQRRVCLTTGVLGSPTHAIRTSFCICSCPATSPSRSPLVSPSSPVPPPCSPFRRAQLQFAGRLLPRHLHRHRIQPAGADSDPAAAARHQAQPHHHSLLHCTSVLCVPDVSVCLLGASQDVVNQ